MKKIITRLIFNVACVIGLVGCSVIPNQMARISQHEVYTQSYEFDDGQNVSTLLTEILGENNRSSLDAFDYLEDALKLGNIEARGMFRFDLTPSPYDRNQFYIDGEGKYFVVNNIPTDDQKGQILYSGDFYLVKKKYEIKDKSKEIDDLTDGILVVFFKQYTVNLSPENKSYYSDTEIQVDFHIDLRFSDNDLYLIDYNKPHLVQVNGSKIGHIHFNTPQTGDEMDKVIDLRGLKNLRDDYHGIYKKNLNNE